MTFNSGDIVWSTIVWLHIHQIALKPQPNIPTMAKIYMYIIIIFKVQDSLEFLDPEISSFRFRYLQMTLKM